MRLLPICVLAGVTSPALFAATVNSGSVDYITSITNATDSLVTSGSGMFLSAGTNILTALAVIMLVVCGLHSPPKAPLDIMASSGFRH